MSCSSQLVSTFVWPIHLLAQTECDHEVKHDLAKVRKGVNEYRAESMGFLTTVTDS